MSQDRFRIKKGPFQAQQLKSGDPYELSNGHPIECLPGGGRHSRANLSGGLVLGTDPEVESAGFDTGYAPDPGNLRAPDIAVGNVPDRPGWVKGAPPLAVEYADTGQNEADLRNKISTLLDAGTRYIWVVRMNGPRKVEVHEAGKPARAVYPGDHLEAPGVLANPVRVEALYDPAAAQDAALHNLLQRHGYPDLDAVRKEGLDEGIEAGRASGELSLVLRQLQYRFDGIGAAREVRVGALPIERIGALAEALLEFDTVHDLDSWLPD